MIMYSTEIGEYKPGYSDDDKTVADRLNQFFLRLKKQRIKKIQIACK